MLHEDGTPTTEQKIKELGDVTRVPRYKKTRGGRVGVGNGAWIESLYGNEKLRRKSMGRNVETFDFTRRQFDVTLPN